nr:DUF2889 domain-containing protein [Nocardioides panzhihuensis]
MAARGPALSAPPRRPGSIRRTSTIDSTWSGGLGGDLVQHGRARDLLTDADGAATVLAEESMRLLVGPDRRIAEIAGPPRKPDLLGLVGAPTGSGYRAVLAETEPDEVDAATPLHLLLDDIPGAVLVSGFAFSKWVPIDKLLGPPGRRNLRVMTGICTGFQPGSSGLAPDGTSRWTHRTRGVAEIDSIDDPLGWHEVTEQTEVSMRRSRRIDVTVEAGTVLVDSFFQDSSTLPEGGRQAVHEYTLTAEIDLATRTLRAVTPVAQVLPYLECPLAVRNVDVLIGLPLRELRPAVLDLLKGTAGCTHLNDALRALADVRVLVDSLEAISN